MDHSPDNPKLPPHNPEAERSVLGGLLIDGSALHRAMDANLEPGDFYRESHQRIYQGVRDLDAKGEPIDWVTLSDILNARNELEKIGGKSYLSKLLEEEFSAAHVGHYSKIVREKAVLRRVIDACTQNIRMAYDGVEDLSEYLDKVQSGIFSIAEAKERGDFIPLKKILVENFKRIEKLHQSNSTVTGLPTGFADGIR